MKGAASALTGGSSTSAAGGKGGGVNVVPMIDVVLCLIVFFLLVGHLASERRVAMDLPRAEAGREAAAAGGPIVINIERPASDGASPRLTIAGREFESPAALAAGVLDESVERTDGARTPSAVTVEVRADRALPFSVVGPVLAELERVGVRRVNLAASRAGSGGGGP